MKKKIYFLSIFILFLFNINTVSAVTSWSTYGLNSNANSGCFGDCSNPYENIQGNAILNTWSTIPGSKNTPVYFDFNIAPSEIGKYEEKYENAVLIYTFCLSYMPGFDFEVITTPPYKYQGYKGKTCVSSYGEGQEYEIIVKTDFSGKSWSSDTVKLTPQSTGDWWLSYKSMSIYTLEQYTNDVFYSQVNDKLDDLNNTQQETNNKLDDLNDNITDSDSSEASGEASDFFSSFNTDTFGLTSVITAPLELIKSVTSKTCTPLQLTLPFVNKELNLPCLSTIYESHFGAFLTIYRTITFGFVSYWVCIKIFNLVKDFKNPEHDEIEVLDL